jgi:hypothetical protein
MFMERNSLHFLGVVVDRGGNEEAVYQFLQPLQREKHILYYCARRKQETANRLLFVFMCA